MGLAAIDNFKGDVVPEPAALGLLGLGLLGLGFMSRRPAAAGGPCSEGPGADGACGRRKPPCAPRRSLRAYRARLSMLALGLTVALIAGFYSLVPVGAARFAALDAGPLTGSHAAFTGEEGCADCHVAHFAGPRAWIRSALGPTDLTEKCSDCHVFGGPARSPHNKTIVLASVSDGTQGKAPGAAARETRTEIDCAACHTEHKGENANISQLTGEQCASCHQIDFVIFDKGHPSFSERYPHFPAQFDQIRSRHPPQHALPGCALRGNGTQDMHRLSPS